MSVEQIEQRIMHIEGSIEGQAQTIEQRRGAIREEVAAIKAWVRRDLDRLVEDMCNQIPAVVDEATVGDLKANLGPFLEKTFRDWAHAETREIGEALEALADKTVALIRDDAKEAGKKLAKVMGTDLQAPVIEVDTFAYDVGVAALATVGLGVFFANWMLGGVLMLAAPILALYMRDRVEEETRRRAKELAPEAIREAAAKVGPKMDEMIDSFASSLDTWVVSASTEVYREVIEVLKAARNERDRGEAARALASSSCQKHEQMLEELRQRMETHRSSIWASDVPDEGQTEAAEN
jgi:hypothetical protein